MGRPQQRNEVIQTLQDRITDLRQSEDVSKRIMIALAGTPGSGKSTIAAALLQRLRENGIDDIAVLPLDGFHYSKAQLNALADPQQARLRRGAPLTYDAEAFIKMIRRLSDAAVTADDGETYNILLPSFDHAIQDPVENDIAIKSNTKVVIVEGNYVLLNQAPWSEIADIVQDRWFVHISREVARDRLVQRHLEAGIEKTATAAERRVGVNDLQNGHFILANLIEPYMILHN